MSHRSAPDLAAGTERLPPGAAYFAVRLAERQIGLASLTIDTLPDGIRITERLDITLPAADGNRRVLATADAELTLDLRLRQFTTTWSGSAERLRATGTVEGDSLLVMETADTAGGSPERVRIPLRGVLTTSAAAPLRLAFGRGFERGAAVTVTELDPLRLVLRPLTLTVAAESVFVVPDSAQIDPATGEWVPARLDTVPAWHLVEGDGHGDRWVDASGYVVAGNTVEGLSVDRSAFEIVSGAYRNAEVAAAEGLRPRGALRRPPARGARLALLADSGFTRAGDPVIGGGVRNWRGDTLAAGRADSAVAEARPGMPERTAGPFVPASDARVAAQARRIIGNAPSSAAAASALVEWVSQTIRLDPAGPGGAIAALTARRGNAVAQAALLVALARSANLPARVVGGVVATPDGRWYRHTWAELYLDSWVPADPAFGRYPADPSYVRLTADRPGHVLAVDPPAARLTPLRDAP